MHESKLSGEERTSLSLPIPVTPVSTSPCAIFLFTLPEIFHSCASTHKYIHVHTYVILILKIILLFCIYVIPLSFLFLASHFPSLKTTHVVSFESFQRLLYCYYNYLLNFCPAGADCDSGHPGWHGGCLSVHTELALLWVLRSDVWARTLS